MARLDDQSRSRLLFVVERYGADDVSEVALRTRSLAALMASRGHSVTVLSTCAKNPSSGKNDMAPGRAVLDGVSVIRFRLEQPQPEAWKHKAAERLASKSPAAARLWARTAGPVVEGYKRYLMHLGHLHDAVLFTGQWTYLVTEGLPLVRKGVLCPTPMSDTSMGMAHAEGLLRASRGVALTTSKHRERLVSMTSFLWRSHTELIRACPLPPIVPSARSRRARFVDGPFLIHVGVDANVAADLAESFLFFRDAHGTTRFEGESGETFHGRDVRLVFVGCEGLPHDPDNGLICLGRLDDIALSALLDQCLAVVHHDQSVHLPTFLLTAWRESVPALLHGVPSDLQSLLDGAAVPFVYDGSATFASSVASLLSRRAPRRVLGARMSEIVRRPFQPAKVALAIEHLVRVLAGEGD